MALRTNRRTIWSTILLIQLPEEYTFSLLPGLLACGPDARCRPAASRLSVAIPTSSGAPSRADSATFARKKRVALVEARGVCLLLRELVGGRGPPRVALVLRFKKDVEHLEG
jgi:hypothetical protein